MHDKYVVNVVTRYDQIFYFPNLVMTRFSHVGGWQVCSCCKLDGDNELRF